MPGTRRSEAERHRHRRPLLHVHGDPAHGGVQDHRQFIDGRLHPPRGIGNPLQWASLRVTFFGSGSIACIARQQKFMSITCIAAWAAVLLLFPIIVLLWATEPREQRARRWRRDGWTQQRIADRLGCSRTTVRRMLA